MSDPNAVFASLLRDPDSLTERAEEILTEEWAVAKKAPMAIPSFQGEPHRLEPEPSTTAPSTTTPTTKAAPKPPPPSWSGAAQRARRARIAASEGRTIRTYTKTIVEADGNRTREQLTNMETDATRRHEELMGAIRPPPASKARTSAPSAPRPKLTAEEKKAAAAARKEKAAAKAQMNAEYWANKAKSFQEH